MFGLVFWGNLFDLCGFVFEWVVLRFGWCCVLMFSVLVGCCVLFVFVVNMCWIVWVGLVIGLWCGLVLWLLFITRCDWVGVVWWFGLFPRCLFGLNGDEVGCVSVSISWFGF